MNRVNRVKRVDVVVIGAGPAGSTAAIHLSRNDREVALIDKANFPRDKCCGDGLTTSALRRLERLGLDPRNIPSWRVIDGTRWRSPEGKDVDISLPNDGARVAIARRSELDDALVRLARHAGAQVDEGTDVTALAWDGHHINVTTSLGTVFRASYVVAADGMWSTTRRLIAPRHRTYLGEFHAFRQYFSNVTIEALDRLWVSFERDLLPGYAWSFPLGDGSVNFGFGIRRELGHSVQPMKQIWRDLLQRPHVRSLLGDDAEPDGRHKAWPIPAALDIADSTAAGGRVLFVGDAARVADPLTGEGIGQAIQTGEMAARMIHDDFGNPVSIARRYKRELAIGLLIDNALAHALVKPLRSARMLSFGMRMVGERRLSMQYPIRWAFEDHPRAALLTPWRWSQRLTEKTGAYL